MKRAYGLRMGLVLGAVAGLTVACGAASPDAGAEAGSTAEVGDTKQELSASALTKQQAHLVLDLVDDICGDSWCEGDHNFHFDQIQCTRPCPNTPGTCRVAFRMFPYDSDLKTGPSYARTCKTPGFTGLASLVETAPNGYQSLNWEFYDSLSACISGLESELPPI